MNSENQARQPGETVTQLAAAGIGAALLLDAIGTRSALCSAFKAMAGGAALYWVVHHRAESRGALAGLPPEQLVELGRS